MVLEEGTTSLFFFINVSISIHCLKVWNVVLMSRKQFKFQLAYLSQCPESLQFI